MIQLEVGKFDAAELYAKKALKIIPDSAAVQDTLKPIQTKRETKRENRSKVLQKRFRAFARFDSML